MALTQLIQFFREGSELPSSLIFPPCRDTGPPSLAGSLFLGVRSPNRRESPDVSFRLARDSRQRGPASFARCPFSPSHHSIEILIASRLDLVARR